MNIPFPIIYPTMIGPDWFNDDRPYDEDEELTKLEEANKRWLNSIGQKYMKPLYKQRPKPGPVQPVAEPEPVPEAVVEVVAVAGAEAGTETDDDVFIVTGNEDVEESEESHDVDEEEDDEDEDDEEEDGEEEDGEEEDGEEEDGEEEEMQITESLPSNNEMESEGPEELADADTVDLEIDTSAIWPYDDSQDQ